MVLKRGGSLTVADFREKVKWSRKVGGGVGGSLTIANFRARKSSGFKRDGSWSQGFTYDLCVYANFREKKRNGFKREVVLGQAFIHI